MFQGYGSPIPAPPQQQQYQQPYSQQAWNGTSPQQAAPPPDVYADPNAFAHMYKSHLAALTFNSKPIITNLTVMAHENAARMANVIAQCLDEHIIQSHPTYRLPAMYVLDSICKNIGAPYVSLWSARIAYLFLETYRLVDQQTKVRMEELLNTWRTAGESGQPLFGGDAQWEIERNLYGSQGAPMNRASLQPPTGFNGHRASPRPTSRSPIPPAGQPHGAPVQDANRARMADHIDRLLAVGTQEQYRNSPSFNPARMSALKQLKVVVQTASLSAQETEQIQLQLDTLSREHEQNTPMTSARSPAPTAAVPTHVGSALENLSKLGLFKPPTPQSSSLHLPAALPAPATDASGDLIKSLMAAGLLPASGSSSTQSSKPASQDDAYESAILALDIKLTSIDLQKELSPQAVELACHRHLPLQCRQCANRYPAGSAGQRSLDQHLDWHFKQGRRAKDSLARGMSRSWLEKIFDWVRGGPDDPSATSGVAGGTSGGKSGVSAQQEEELKAASEAWVAAPSQAELANAPCPICKEKFQSEWSEDEEEWIWKNARKVEGHYYHGSCYYSAKSLSQNVSNRTTTPPGRRSSDRRSRTATPPARKTPVNPVERLKAEDVGEQGGSRKRKASPTAAEGDADESQESVQSSKRIAA